LDIDQAASSYFDKVEILLNESSSKTENMPISFDKYSCSLALNEVISDVFIPKLAKFTDS